MDSPFLFVDDIETAGKRCLVRLDLNVPLADGVVGDDTRIRRVLPGLEALCSAGARLIIMTHLGRPKGRRVPAMSVAPVAGWLAALLGRPVQVVRDITGQQAADAADADVIAKLPELIGEDGLACTDCHHFQGEGKRPDLTGYGSRDWTVDFIKDPSHKRFYGTRNDRMPTYGGTADTPAKLTDQDIGLIVDWLRSSIANH